MKRCIAILLCLLALPAWGGRTFNGSSDKIQVAGGSPLVSLSAATILCVFRVTSVPGSEVDICSNGGQEGGSHDGPVIIMVGSTFYGTHNGQIGISWWQNQPEDHNIDLFCSFTISTNTWYVVASSFTEPATPGTYLYVNGTSCGSTSTNNTLGVESGGDNPDVCMGGYAASGNPGTCTTPNFAGTIANFALWNVALKPAQLAALSSICPVGYSARRMGLPPPLRYWPLWGASGSSIEPDLSGNVANGTLTGTSAANQPPCTP